MSAIMEGLISHRNSVIVEKGVTDGGEAADSYITTITRSAFIRGEIGTIRGDFIEGMSLSSKPAANALLAAAVEISI